MRYKVTENINKLYKKYNTIGGYNNIQDRKERKLINNITRKLEENSAMITKADKGNSVVILTYHDKIHNFIQNNDNKRLNK